MIEILIVRCFLIDEHQDLFVFYVFTNEIVFESKLSRLLIVFMSFSTWVNWRLICRILVWDFMLIFDLASREIWTWSCLSNWFDWLKELVRFVELSSSMQLRSCQWLNVTYSYSRRRRNTSISKSDDTELEKWSKKKKFSYTIYSSKRCSSTI